MAGWLGERTVTYYLSPFVDWSGEMVLRRIPCFTILINGSDAETEAHVALWRSIREGRLATVTDTVERILGRKPIALDRWVAENSASFR